MGAVKALSMDGLFIGQTKEFMELLTASINPELE